MKILLTLLLVLSCSLCYGAINDMGGYAWTPITKTYSTSGTASGAIVWTPSSGKKIVLLGVFMSGKSGMANNEFQFETGFNHTSTVLADGTDIIPPFTSSGPTVIGTGVPIWKGSADAEISFTSSKTCIPAITLWGYETN